MTLSTHAQDLKSDYTAAQVYFNLEDFWTDHKEGGYILRSFSDPRTDSIGERYWFSDEHEGLIKNVFGVRIHERLFFREEEIWKNLPMNFRPHADKMSKLFCPVLEEGDFLYLELWSHEKDPALGIALGLLTGAIGQATGEAMASAHWVKSAVIIWPKGRLFQGIDSWHDVHYFLQHHQIHDEWPVEEKDFSLEAVRSLVLELNQQE